MLMDGLSPLLVWGLMPRFIGLLYIVLLPVGMVSAVAYAVVSGIAGKGEAFSWRPAEAYLSGKKKTRKQVAPENKQPEQK